MINNISSDSQYLRQLQPNNFGQSQNGTQQPASGSIATVDGVKSAVENSAVTQAAADFDIMQHPWLLTKNLALCFLMSAGFTQGTNWLMSSKKIADGASHLQDFQNNRLYQFGEKIDTHITKTATYGKVTSLLGRFKANVAKVPVPEFMKEIGRRMKIGSFSTWDKTGMWSLGKGVESMNEAIEFVSGVAKADLDKLKLSPQHMKHLTDTLNDAKKGIINNTEAFKRIHGKGYMDGVSAKILKELTVGDPAKAKGVLNKFFGTTPNINMAWAKAKYFNGLHTTQGPIAKTFQKLVGYIGEASGNGVLGGKGAVIMGSFGLVTGFNAASKAEKGDKFKAFMEDYVGFTLGSYLMSFVVGKWFNKFLGITELGLDHKEVKSIATKLGVDASRGLVQENVVAYNRKLKDYMQAEKLLNKIKNNKVKTSANWFAKLCGAEDIASMTSKVQKLLNVDSLPSTTLSDLQQQLVNFNAGKNPAYFVGIKNEIKAALKSKITIGSIFKATEHNKGNFFSRLGKYLLHKPLRKFGQLLSVGRYTMFTTGKGLNFFRKFKTIGGGVGRIILVGFVLVSPFSKLFMRVSNAIFGKPKHSQLDEEKREKEAKAAEKAKENALKNAPKPLPEVNVINRDGVKPGENLLQKTIANSNNKPVEASVPQEQPVLTEAKRTYVPSPMPNPSISADAPSPQEQAANAVLARADYAEQAAMKFVK